MHLCGDTLDGHLLIPLGFSCGDVIEGHLYILIGFNDKSLFFPLFLIE